MSDTYSKMRKKRDQRAHQLGGGPWLRKSDRLQVLVEVEFYPSARLYINEAGQRREIKLGELQQRYERLRL